MSLKYKLIERRNLGKDQASNPKKLYAVPVYSDLVSFEELLGEISEAGIPSNQVKGVFDRMIYLMKKHLAAGRRVQFGEFGNFRYGVGSEGALTEEAFKASLIRQPRVIFSPGSALRKARKNTVFEKSASAPVDTGSGDDDNGDDVIM